MCVCVRLRFIVSCDRIMASVLPVQCVNGLWPSALSSSFSRTSGSSRSVLGQYYAMSLAISETKCHICTPNKILECLYDVNDSMKFGNFLFSVIEVAHLLTMLTGLVRHIL